MTDLRTRKYKGLYISEDVQPFCFENLPCGRGFKDALTIQILIKTHATACPEDGEESSATAISIGFLIHLQVVKSICRGAFLEYHTQPVAGVVIHPF